MSRIVPMLEWPKALDTTLGLMSAFRPRGTGHCVELDNYTIKLNR